MGDDGVLQRLAQAAADLGPAIEPPGLTHLLDTIAQTAHELTGAAACSIAVLDRATEELHFVAATGPGAASVVGMRMDAHKGIAGWALASGQSITVGEVSQDPRFARDVAEATGYLPTTIFAIPLEGDDGPVGVLEILDADESAFSDEKTVAALMGILAQQATVAIATSFLFEDLGRVLFSAAARAAESADDDIRDALAGAASAAQGPTKDLAQLLTVFAELSAIGPEERQSAARLLYDFLTYVRDTRGGGAT